MNREELPRGGRMLEQGKDESEAVEREPSLPETPLTVAEELKDAKPRRAPRRRRKPFVL
jgi:hypothetical protein